MGVEIWYYNLKVVDVVNEEPQSTSITARIDVENRAARSEQEKA